MLPNLPCLPLRKTGWKMPSNNDVTSRVRTGTEDPLTDGRHQRKEDDKARGWHALRRGDRDHQPRTVHEAQKNWTEAAATLRFECVKEAENGSSTRTQPVAASEVSRAHH